MCIAIYAPGTARLLTFEEFENCQSNNSDGMGLVWSDEGKLRIIRRMSGVGKFYKAYRTIHERGKDMLVHFRFATHGAEDMSNVHPVAVGTDMAFIHNGILSGFGEGKTGKSDTRHFGDAVLKALPDGWMEEESYWSTVEHLTLGSKLAFMTAAGKVKIMHEGSGAWDEGNWMSNTSYKNKNYWRQSYHNYTATDWDGEWGTEYGPGANKGTSGFTPRSSLSMADTGRFSGGYYYTEKELIICEPCLNRHYSKEPLRHFVPLWDDGVGLNCDHCSFVIIGPYEGRKKDLPKIVVNEDAVEPVVPLTKEESEAALAEALATASRAADMTSEGGSEGFVRVCHPSCADRIAEGGAPCSSVEIAATPMGG